MRTNATFGQAVHTLTLLSQLGLDAEHLRILHDGYLADLVEGIKSGKLPSRDDFRKMLGLGPSTMSITVDYCVSLAAMVAAGQYDWVHSDITPERFPLKGEGAQERAVELVHFNRDVTSEAAVTELAKRGLRPATIEELLAFGAKYPDEQRKFPVVALGSSCRVDGYRRVACLSRDGSERRLSLSWWDVDWVGRSRFLAVRKVSGV